MKILVIGGSYFFGRVFVYTACREHEVTVVNRGHRALNAENVREFRANRHDPDRLAQIPGEYDAVVDFCAFAAGDIRTVTGALRDRFKQYIFVSTVDALWRGTGTVKDESAPYETRDFGGQTGEYILGKAALEKELMAQAAENGFAFTIVRPAIIYGPYNYAPREPYYLRRIAEGQPIYEPVLAEPGGGTRPADGQFQFVFVRDAARMTLALSGRESAYNEIYHLAAPERITYREFFRVLGNMRFPGTDIRQIPYDDAGNTHFPFPVTARETELYSGEKIVGETGISYTDFESGMSETLRVMYK